VDLDDTPEQAAYRAQVRAWLDQNKSQAPVLQGPGALEDEAEILAARRVWQGKLAEGGLAGVTWPKEYGGQGLGPIEQVICNQEVARAKVPGILDAIGVGMLGPTIIAHGSEEQKTRYLGALLHGDEVWCQLFSEPAAGSDLAAVQTRARLQDDGSWRLSGQKVWTTNAQFASYGLLLARTDADVPKHKGMTMFIVPMDGDGVTVRGLRQISGEAEFNEVFFDDLELDASAVVGGVGNGWGTALTTLMFERVTIGLGGEGMGYNSTRFAAAIAADPQARRDPEVRQLGQALARAEDRVEVHHRLAHAHEHAVAERRGGAASRRRLLQAPEVQDLVEDLRRSQVASKAHRPGGAEAARQRAARLRGDADRSPPVAEAHQHGLQRPAVTGCEQGLDGAVGRVRLLRDGQARERQRLGERRAQVRRKVGHLLVSARATRRPRPHLAGAEGGLPAVGERRLEKLEIHCRSAGGRAPGGRRAWASSYGCSR